MLRAELAFCVGCLNLREALAANAGPICFPKPEPKEANELGAHGLYDLSLALTGAPSVVGNDLDAEGKNLIMVTGANEGGKSTFLRSVGAAQLMMQCGMFVCANYFSSSISAEIHTHFKREEDAELNSGKLDEELERMSGIADTISPHSLVLFNESFSATNEREGSAIARNIISALVESRMRVVFVTHFFDLLPWTLGPTPARGVVPAGPAGRGRAADPPPSGRGTGKHQLRRRPLRAGVRCGGCGCFRSCR